MKQEHEIFYCGNNHLGFCYVSDGIKVRDAKKVQKLADKYQERIDAIRDEFDEELESIGLTNTMGVVVYTKDLGEI